MLHNVSKQATESIRLKLYGAKVPYIQTFHFHWRKALDDDMARKEKRKDSSTRSDLGPKSIFRSPESKNISSWQNKYRQYEWDTNMTSRWRKPYLIKYSKVHLLHSAIDSVLPLHSSWLKICLWRAAEVISRVAMQRLSMRSHTRSCLSSAGSSFRFALFRDICRLYDVQHDATHR